MSATAITNTDATKVGVEPARPRRRIRASLRVIRSDWALLSGTIILVVILLAVVVGPLLYDTSPLTPSQDVIQGPSSEHWLGTDPLGRDVLARVLAGMRTSLLISLVATTLVCVVGI